MVALERFTAAAGLCFWLAAASALPAGSSITISGPGFTSAPVANPSRIEAHGARSAPRALSPRRERKPTAFQHRSFRYGENLRYRDHARYGEELRYRPGTALRSNVYRGLSARGRYGTGFLYRGAGHTLRDSYKPDIRYGHGLRYGQGTSYGFAR